MVLHDSVPDTVPATHFAPVWGASGGGRGEGGEAGGAGGDGGEMGGGNEGSGGGGGGMDGGVMDTESCSVHRILVWYPEVEDAR